MKTYDLVKEILTKYPETRNSDNKLIWEYCDETLKTSAQLLFEGTISMRNFMTIPFETIRRCRQKIQQITPSLRATAGVRFNRQQRAEQRGTHIFREEIQ